MESDEPEVKTWEGHVFYKWFWQMNFSVSVFSSYNGDKPCPTGFDTKMCAWHSLVPGRQ